MHQLALKKAILFSSASRRLLGYYLISAGFIIATLPIFAVGQLLGFLSAPLLIPLIPILQYPLGMGLRLVTRRAREVSAADLRRPVLLLRSFRDDRLQVRTMSHLRRVLLLRFYPWNYTTLEEMLVRIFSRSGPVVAIGRPGEIVPPLGAAREWVGNEAWQGRVEELLSDCRLVVVIVGGIESATGFRWEMERIIRLEMLHKVVFVIPPLRERRISDRLGVLTNLLGNRVPAYQGGELALRFLPDGSTVVLRSKKRWVKDYLQHLKPLAPRCDTLESLTLRSISIKAIGLLYPVKDETMMSRHIRLIWLLLVPILGVVVFAILTEMRHTTLALAWGIFWTAFFGWFIARVGDLHTNLHTY